MSDRSNEDNNQSYYSFTDEKKEFKLGDIFTIEKFGEPINYTEIPSCAFNGLDKTYIYEHYEVMTYPDGSVDRILSIYILDDKISTTEGIKISDSYNDMIKKYGNNYKKDFNQYIYELNKAQIIFIVENNIIISIEYKYNI